MRRSTNEYAANTNSWGAELMVRFPPGADVLRSSDSGLGGGHIRRRRWTKALSAGNELEAHLSQLWVVLGTAGCRGKSRSVSRRNVTLFAKATLAFVMMGSGSSPVSGTTLFKLVETLGGEPRDRAEKVADFCWSTASSVLTHRASETQACGGRAACCHPRLASHRKG